MFVIDDSIVYLKKKIITMRITCRKVILVIGRNDENASIDWYGIKSYSRILLLENSVEILPSLSGIITGYSLLEQDLHFIPYWKRLPGN